MTGGMAELTEVDVEAMVRDARAGDAAALGQLYETYRDRVARFATGRLGDAEKAEDVTSETFEAVLRNLGSYRPGTDFEAWLFTPEKPADLPATAATGSTTPTPTAVRRCWPKPSSRSPGCRSRTP